MRTVCFRTLARLTSACLLICGVAHAEPKHGIAMYGEPALGPEFLSLPYANPVAPKGGKIVFGETGGFDSLNPHIRKGRVPWQMRFITYESLMGRSWDEPFTLYGLLAEMIEVPDDRSWVEFTLREEARFSDGSPVTIEDVLWSYETLGTQGHPRYLGAWKKVQSAEITGPRSIRFTFNVEDREMALIIGLRPILKKDQFSDIDFAESGIDNIPIGSAPYVVGDFEPGRFVTFDRDPNYWGKDLAFRRGTNNLDQIRIDYFGDGAVAFEAFKAGETNTQREFNAAKWDSQYDFPAIDRGDVIKSIIKNQRPSGITGFVMNTRRDIFKDWRVRDAMIHAFNFEFINEKLTGGKQPRISSYFSNSVLAMRDGPAEGRVKDFLDPFSNDLLPGALGGYELPVSNGSERNRANILKANALLEDAGWTVKDGTLSDQNGNPFAFEILLRQGSNENQQIIDFYVEALKRLGVAPTVTVVDSAQYKERTQIYDFDMAYYRRGLSLSPGNEQNLYWGSGGVEEPGSRNWMGMNSRAAEAMINKLVNSRSREDFLAATRALDRILTTGRFVIPIYQWNISRIAHSKDLRYPDYIPMYGDWIGWQPDVWWHEEN